MNFNRRTVITPGLIMLSLLLLNALANADLPKECRIAKVARIQQLQNYCGPAALACVMEYFGSNVTQEDIGKVVYDPLNGATNGADMLLFARDKGFAAYSWNADSASLKKVLADGIPVIVLQQNSMSDISGHYRVIVGYDDATSKYFVVDPYYEITEMSYSNCEKLWKRMGNWALMVTPADKDKFKDELRRSQPRRSYGPVVRRIQAQGLPRRP